MSNKLVDFMKGNNLELTQEDNERIFKNILGKLKNIGYPINDSETFEAEDEPREPYEKTALEPFDKK